MSPHNNSLCIFSLGIPYINRDALLRQDSLGVVAHFVRKMQAEDVCDQNPQGES